MLTYDEGGQASLFAPDSFYGKMCQARSAAERRGGRTSGPSWRRSSALKTVPVQCLDLTPGAGNLLGQSCWELNAPWLGAWWTLNSGASPREEKESCLSQILEDRPRRKYYLSRKACLGILRRARERGKALPAQLQAALLVQAGLSREASPVSRRAFAAGFSAGAGSSAGSIAYSERVAPTLKGSPSGSCMPSVLCLNDQGGRSMDWSEETAGTLRAQEHGHQPLVFENHGVDARCTGPHRVAPTLASRAGTGGMAGRHTVFSRQRVDEFRDDMVTGTQSARQHKDATDLVLDAAAGPFLIRRLTPLECERLMGFPDGWTDIPGASDSARYRALGNSVAIPCVEYLMRGVALAAGGGD